jgi:hypothetical protein
MREANDLERSVGRESPGRYLELPVREWAPAQQRSGGWLARDNAGSPPPFLPPPTIPILALLKTLKEEQALSSLNSLTPKDLCSIQVRD